MPHGERSTRPGDTITALRERIISLPVLVGFAVEPVR